MDLSKYIRGLPKETFENVCDYLKGRDILRLKGVCADMHKRVQCSAEMIWEAKCLRYGYRQHKTRTRGGCTWLNLFLKNLCIECRNPGRFVIGKWILAPRNDVVLCQRCFDDVTKMTTWTERRKKALRKARARLGGDGQRFYDLLLSVPYKKKKRKTKRKRRGLRAKGT